MAEAQKATLAQEIQELQTLHVNGTLSEEQLASAKSAAISAYGGGNQAGTGAEELHKLFAAQEQRRLWSWRPQYEKFLSDRASIEAETNAELEEQFVELGKNNMLTPTTMLFLSYLISGHDKDRRFFAGCLARFSAADCVKAHNFRVADKAGEAFLATHGDNITSLQWPLFPHVEGFKALNLRMLTDCAQQHVSGGSEQRVPSVFRVPTSVIEGGEYYGRHVQGADGSTVTDLNEVEAAFSDMNQRLVQQGQMVNQQRQQLAQLRNTQMPRGQLNGGRGASPAGRGGRNNNATGRGGRGGQQQQGCYNCGQLGHMRRDCRRPPRAGEHETEERTHKAEERTHTPGN